MLYGHHRARRGELAMTMPSIVMCVLCVCVVRLMHRHRMAIVEAFEFGALCFER